MKNGLFDHFIELFDHLPNKKNAMIMQMNHRRRDEFNSLAFKVIFFFLASVHKYCYQDSVCDKKVKPIH